MSNALYLNTFILYLNTAPVFEYVAVPYSNTLTVLEYIAVLYLNTLLVYKNTV